MAPNTAVSCLALLCFLTTQRDCYAGSPAKTAALPALMAALSDGPIQVRPSALPPGSISAASAAQAAQTSIGVRYSRAQAWPVLFTDRENLSRPAPKLPCWLVASSQPFTLPLKNEFSPQAALRKETLYAVVNARLGVLVEAFSRPRAAWWRRVVVTNEAFLRGVNEQQQETAFPAVRLPPLPLARPYCRSISGPSSALVDRFGGGRADQFIARYFVYTDLGSKMLHTPGSTDFQYEFLRQPVWDICLEGLNTPIGGPVQLFAPPMPPHEPGSVRFPRQEELSTVVNAATGESFDTQVSRSGRQVDMF